MADCQMIEKCIFFNDKMANMPGMSEIFKDRYCREEFEACARFRVCAVVGRENVPSDLFPNQQERVKALIMA